MNPLISLPLVCLITSRRAFRHNPELQIDLIATAARSGCNMIQIREKDMAAGDLLEFTRWVIDVARPHNARVIVNDRLDVALAASADGVHLPVNSLPISTARSIAISHGLQNFLIGASTHSMLEACSAESSGADYIVFGPVFDTPSKRVYGLPVGLESLSEACRTINIPVLAIGGIDPTNIGLTVEAGASGIAAIRLFQDLGTIKRNIEVVINAFSRH